jgi:hypothetical protein
MTWDFPIRTVRDEYRKVLKVWCAERDSNSKVRKPLSRPSLGFREVAFPADPRKLPSGLAL